MISSKKNRKGGKTCMNSMTQLLPSPQNQTRISQEKKPITNIPYENRHNTQQNTSKPNLDTCKKYYTP